MLANGAKFGYQHNVISYSLLHKMDVFYFIVISFSPTILKENNAFLLDNKGQKGWSIWQPSKSLSLLSF